jgi:hypothetical protein
MYLEKSRTESLFIRGTLFTGAVIQAKRCSLYTEVLPLFPKKSCLTLPRDTKVYRHILLEIYLYLEIFEQLLLG